MALSELTKPELEELADEHEITFERGSGADGAVLKSDLIAALLAAGVGEEKPSAREPGETKLYRVMRHWNGLSPGSVVAIDPARAWQFSSENDERKSSPPHLSPLDT